MYVCMSVCVCVCVCVCSPHFLIRSSVDEHRLSSCVGNNVAVSMSVQILSQGDDFVSVG